jgi:Tfp pilus assembly protein PilN
MAETGSFIPKQQPRITPRVRRRRVYIINYVIFTFFLCVVLVTVGLFAWEWQLGNQLQDRQTALNEQRGRFSQSDILRIKEVEARLNTVASLLDTQPATSKVFTALNSVTLESVQLQNFTVTPETTPNTLLVSFSGVTDSFDAVLAQRLALQANPLFANAEVREVQYSISDTIDDTNTGATASSVLTPVQFTVSLVLPMSDVMFDGVLASQTELLAQGVSVENQGEVTQATSTPSATLETEMSSVPSS